MGVLPFINGVDGQAQIRKGVDKQGDGKSLLFLWVLDTALIFMNVGCIVERLLVKCSRGVIAQFVTVKVHGPGRDDAPLLYHCFFSRRTSASQMVVPLFRVSLAAFHM